MSTLHTFRQFSEKNPAFPEGGLRALRFNAEKNGFGPAFVKIGRKVLIDEARFFEIVEKQNGGR